MTKEDMIENLMDWGRWQRSAKNPSLKTVISQLESPLRKERNVKPIYTDTRAEYLDNIIAQYLPPEYRMILVYTYVDQLLNLVAADILKCSVKTYMVKRGEAIAMLVGIYRVLNNRLNSPKIAQNF